MSDNTAQDVGSYIVRDKRGTYMSGYNLKLGKSKAHLWARDCAKRSKGVLYFRQDEGGSEEELENFLAAKKK
jgi:hypothetical protein